MDAESYTNTQFRQVMDSRAWWLGECNRSAARGGVGTPILPPKLERIIGQSGQNSITTPELQRNAPQSGINCSPSHMVSFSSLLSGSIGQRILFAF